MSNATAQMVMNFSSPDCPCHGIFMNLSTIVQIESQPSNVHWAIQIDVQAGIESS
jgi:hypothetical protein